MTTTTETKVIRCTDGWCRSRQDPTVAAPAKFIAFADRAAPAGFKGRLPGVIASDGRFVFITDYACGVHARSTSYRNKIALPETATGDKMTDAHLVLAAYEALLAEDAARSERFRIEYEESQRENAVETHHVVISDRRGEMNWDIVSDSNGRGIGGITVSKDGGVYTAHVYGAAGFVGKGSGSVSHLRTLSAIAIDAAEYIERKNAEEAQ